MANRWSYLMFRSLWLLLPLLSCYSGCTKNGRVVSIPTLLPRCIACNASETSWRAEHSGLSKTCAFIIVLFHCLVYCIAIFPRVIYATMPLLWHAVELVLFAKCLESLMLLDDKCSPTEIFCLFTIHLDVSHLIIVLLIYRKYYHYLFYFIYSLYLVL